MAMAVTTTLPLFCGTYLIKGVALGAIQRMSDQLEAADSEFHHPPWHWEFSLVDNGCEFSYRTNDKEISASVWEMLADEFGDGHVGFVGVTNFPAFH